ncbi:hypothetical protein TcarDRAFT_0795, partial [Thermosinus carboxydivorans Nor1]
RWVYWTCVALAVVIAVVAWAYLHKPPPVTVMAQEEVRDPVQVAQKIDVPQSVAREIVREVQVVTQTPPAATYTVQATDTKKAAQMVEQQIKLDKAPVSLPPADKTIVTPREQKVDVYRITLDKPRAVGVYASTESVGIMAQYKNIIVFGGPKYQGGYEIGAAYMIRW